MPVDSAGSPGPTGKGIFQSEYCMSDRDEGPKKRRRQGAENFLAEDILQYFEVWKFFCNAAYGGLSGLAIDSLMQYSG